MTGALVRLAGPTAVADGLDGVALNELVLVGEERLLGEVIRVEGARATLQVYEDTTGLDLRLTSKSSGRASATGSPSATPTKVDAAPRRGASRPAQSQPLPPAEVYSIRVDKLALNSATSPSGGFHARKIQ